VMNALLGWTLVGWVVALGRALRPAGVHVATEPLAAGNPGKRFGDR
jgi:hypothetical protein